MLDEYQQQGQQIQDQLQQSYDQLEELRQTLFANYPEEDRTYRMGKAMTALGNTSVLLQQAMGALQQIEWPTEERPR